MAMQVKLAEERGKEKAAGKNTRNQSPSTTRISKTYGMAGLFLTLQRTYGNGFLQRLLNEPVIRRECSCGGTCDHCQSESAHREENITKHILQRKGGGRPLEPEVRTFMESRFGEDLSGVRVHTDTHAAETAEWLNAVAYTVGRDIFFGAGKYNPQSTEGKRLLAHELTHVVQQDFHPVADTRKPRGISISNPLDGFEREANRMAESVMFGLSGSSRATPVLTPRSSDSTHTLVQRQTNSRNIRYRCGTILGCPLIEHCDDRACAVADCGRGSCRNPLCRVLGLDNIIWRAWCSYRCVPSGSAFLFFSTIGNFKVGPFCLD
jgi:hypothetical protein